MKTAGTIRFQCDKCGKWLRVAVGRAGSKGRCTGCGYAVVAPQVTERPATTKPFVESDARDSAGAPSAHSRAGSWALGGSGLTVVASAVILIMGPGLRQKRDASSVNAAAVAIEKKPDEKGPAAQPVETNEIGVRCTGSSPQVVEPSSPAAEPPPSQTGLPHGLEPSQVAEARAYVIEPGARTQSPPSVGTSATQPKPTDLREAVEKGLRVQGEVKFDTRTEYGFNRNTTYHQWKLGLSLENRTGLTLELGKDLLLYESNDDGSAFNGVAVIARKLDVTDPSTYGFDYSYETLNRKIMRTDDYFSISFSGSQDKLADLVPLPSGQNRSLRWTLEQMTWLRDELRARLVVVLPEVRLQADGGVEKYRLVVYLPKPPQGTTWVLGKQTLIPLRSDRLAQMLADPESNKISKLLAANWLAEADPQAAVPALLAAAHPLGEGQLLASCLEILTSLKGDGLGAHAVGLLSNKGLPNGIRGRAAQYLGAVRYSDGLPALIELASDQDEAVANGAIVGLGSFGNPKSVEALTGLLNDPKQNKRHSLVAKSLARTKSPKAIQTLKELAQRANKDALEALVSAGSPETFDFFVAMSQKPQPKETLYLVARGLRSSGGERAIPPLLVLLEKDNAPDAKNPTQADTLVDQLAALNGKEESSDFAFLSSEARTDGPSQFAPGKATPRLVQLARAGNLRSMQVLAKSNHESARVPLQDLARTARGDALHVVLDGLSRHWAPTSVDLFARGLVEADTSVVRTAIQGLQESKDARAPGLLAPLLRHPDRDLRQTVVYSLSNLKLPEAVLPIVADAVVEDSNDAIVSTLAEILIRANWRDATAIKPLGKKLHAASELHKHGYVKLLRHVSRNAMGPSDDNEYYKDQKGWAGKWVSWAATH